MRNWKIALNEYIQKYGPKTLIMMEVGSFYECYAVSDSQLDHLKDACRIMSIRVTRKNLVGDIKIDSKQYLTYNLCNYFEKINLLSIFKVIDNTVFGKLNIDNFKNIEPDNLLDIYSEFIHCESNLSQTSILKFLKNKIKFLKDQFNRNLLR